MLYVFALRLFCTLHVLCIWIYYVLQPLSRRTLHDSFFGNAILHPIKYLGQLGRGPGLSVGSGRSTIEGVRQAPEEAPDERCISVACASVDESKARTCIEQARPKRRRLPRSVHSVLGQLRLTVVTQ